MRTLCVAGIVTCSRGVSGGFQLKKAASEITLLDIVEAIEWPMERHIDSLQFAMPQSTRRTLTPALYDATVDARKRLAAVALADLRASEAAEVEESIQRFGELHSLPNTHPT